MLPKIAYHNLTHCLIVADNIHSFVIEIPGRSSLFLSIESIINKVIFEFVKYDQSMVSLLKVSYLIKLSSRCITISVINVQACNQVYQKAAYYTFLANFLLRLY